MRRRPVLGIDPGTPGAAVLLDDAGACQLAVYWHEINAGRSLALHWWSRARGAGGERLAPRYSAVGAALLDLLAVEDLSRRCLLRIEGVFVGKNPTTAITLAQASGELLAPIQEHLDQEAQTVKATAWRRALLGLPVNTRSAAAKAASVRSMPLRVPGLSDALTVLGEHDHITDAAGVAQSGQVSR